MTHKRYPPSDPREWIQRARSNLVQATYDRPEIYLEDLCFQAQQAAEKALKAMLLHYQQDFPYTHDLSYLVWLIEENIMPVPDELQDVAVLTRYAVATRYPGTIEEVSRTEYIEALELASRTVVWAEQMTQSKE
jgi:HEPN domain-containing protein